MDLQTALHDRRPTPVVADDDAADDAARCRATTRRTPRARRDLDAKPPRPLETLDADLAGLPAHRAIRIALRRAERPMVVTDFGPDAAALLALVQDARPDVPIVWIETGLETDATRRFAQAFARERSLALHVVHPTIDAETLRRRRAATTPENVRELAELIDTVRDAPLRRAFDTLEPDLVITDARRRSVDTDAFTLRPDGRLEYAPLFDWDDARTAAFLAARELPNGHAFDDPLSIGAGGNSLIGSAETTSTRR